MRNKTTALTACCLLFSAAIVSAAERRPSILFCSPQGPTWGWIDLTYLSELHAKGLEVDYTENLADVTWDRIRNYNVLVIYVTPDAYDVATRGLQSSPEKAKAFAELIERYVTAGGGVFLMPTEANVLKQAVADLTGRWGAKLPVELIEETDKEKTAALTHASHQVPLALTDQVLPSPLSEGVKQIWYPISISYNAQHTGPLWVDENWQVVVKGSKTTRTKPVDLAKSTMPVLEDPFQRPAGVQEPPLMAIRQYQAGRIALVNQWRQYSIGSGTRYIFQRQVLSAGAKGKPSDFGRLLENTLRWLAGPPLAGSSLGGYVTSPDRLLPPNENPTVKRDYAERFWPYDPATLGTATMPPGTRIYRGLLGAKTSYSSGKAGVEAYARAATAAGLDFLIFMDDFDKLTADKLKQLTADCRKYSSEKLLLLPGFCIQNNIGNRTLFYSPEPVWIPDYCLTGPGKKLLYIQQEDGKGNFTGFLTPFLDWALSAYHVEKGQIGYYDFTGSPKGMRMHDLRLYGMAAVRYYRDGKLVDDRTADYLTTAQCTIPPAPASVNEVSSPDELLREVQSGHSLLCARARSLGTLFMDALRWSHQYDSLPIFTSDGPQVLAWAGCHRVSTLGAEPFVTGPSVMPSPLCVTAEKGIKEICIYNGQHLFRRFLPGGAKEFQRTLVLDGTVQKNLVVVAEDMDGRKAITFARRCWKDGSLAASFCSDHVNDGTMALAHGPYSYPLIRHPTLPTDIAGDTWDGGPTASLPLIGYQDTVLVLECDKGKEDGHRFDQIPLLEFADEGALAVSSERREVFDDKVLQVVNPWHTYGPIAGPSRWMEHTQRYREYLPATIGVPQSGWAGPPVLSGTNASLLRNEITFKENLKIKSLHWGRLGGSPASQLVLSLAGTLTTIDSAHPAPQSFVLRHGDWFGYLSTRPANSNLFFHRGEPLSVETYGTAMAFRESDQEVRRGQTRVWEVAAIGMPINVEIRSAAALKRYADYMREPAGMRVLRGKRLDGPGLVEFAPDAALGVEIVIPRPVERLDLTLPCRIHGLNGRWTAGLWQKNGYVKGDYGSGENRYRALGLDLEGTAYVPLYVDRAELTHVVAGHPIIAGPEGRDLFIQVTKVKSAPDRWHVSVNNPTDRAIVTTLKKAMDLPGLEFPDRTLTIPPGGYLVLM